MYTYTTLQALGLALVGAIAGALLTLMVVTHFIQSAYKEGAIVFKTDKVK